MRTYALEDRGSTPLYEYLYRCIREDILAGALAAGERLPSKRALAEHLHIGLDHVYCVGDEANDLPMLRLAAEGFAPANCIPAVRDSGATIVSHALDGALADVVEILEQKYR